MQLLLALLRKDALIFWRSKRFLVSAFGFSLLLIVVASLSFRTVGWGQHELKDVTPGILWLVFLFTGVLGLNHSFSAECDSGVLQRIMLCGASPSYVFFSKAIINLFFISIIQVFVIIVHGIFFGVDYFNVFFELFAVSFLASIGFCLIGTLMSAIVSTTSVRELLLPLVIFPVSIPLVSSAVEVSRGLIISGKLPLDSFSFLLLLVFDVTVFMLGWILFPCIYSIKRNPL